MNKSKIKQSLKTVSAVSVLVGGSLVGADAFAASGIDTTATVSAVQGVGTNIEAVGLAIIGLAATALGIRWIKATFF